MGYAQFYQGNHSKLAWLFVGKKRKKALNAAFMFILDLMEGEK